MYLFISLLKISFCMKVQTVNWPRSTWPQHLCKFRSSKLSTLTGGAIVNLCPCVIYVWNNSIYNKTLLNSSYGMILCDQLLIHDSISNPVCDYNSGACCLDIGFCRMFLYPSIGCGFLVQASLAALSHCIMVQSHHLHLFIMLCF